MIFKKLLLIRAGERHDKKIKDYPLSNSSLSNIGRLQIAEIYKKVSHYMTMDDIIDIYCPNSKSAIESSEIIKGLFLSSGVIIRNFKKSDYLYSDPFQDYDLEWIKEELKESTATAIIIVGHIELVRWLPQDLGKSKNYAKAGEGIFIYNGSMEKINIDI